MKIILLILNRKQPKIKKTNKGNKTDDKDLLVKQLELELTSGEDMRSITEDQGSG
jgi:hypothetical protein